MELTHAGPKDAVREAELKAPSGVVCSDLVQHMLHFKTHQTLPTMFDAGKLPNWCESQPLVLAARK